MNTNKISAMLQANKVWTILARMGYHVEMTIYKDDENIKTMNVRVFLDKDKEDEEKSLLDIIHRNCIEGDITETKEFDDFICIRYETRWENK